MENKFINRYNTFCKSLKNLKIKCRNIMNKRFYIIFPIVLICILVLAGCNNRSMNYIIEHEPSISGIVEEVRYNSILIYIQTDGYPGGASCEVSLDVENTDSYTDVLVGDEVVVYFDGIIAESDPLQINTVYAITLRTPAKDDPE